MGLENYRPDLPGNFADIWIGRTETGRTYIKKLFGLRIGGYTLEDANNGIQLMDRFITIASEVGLPVATVYEHSIQKLGDSDKFAICQLQEYLGRDLGRILGEEPNIDEVIKGYLQCCGIVSSSGYRVAIDPHVPNFCMDVNGIVKYVDLMPPRQWIDGTRVAVFPREEGGIIEPYFLDRCFTAEGQVVDIYAKILKFMTSNSFYNDPETPQRVKDLIVNYFDSETLDKLTDGCALRYRHKYDNLNQKDGDIIRVLGAEMYFRGEITHKELEEIYALTHITPFGVLPDFDNIYSAASIISL